MTNDAWRAVQHHAREFAQSETGRTIGREALRSFLQRVLPHLWDWIDNRFHDIWSWFRQTF
jgi:hypothetical protein